MTDTPRETILADIRNRLAKTTPMNHPLLKLFRYEHGGGRLFIDGESGARELIADFYSAGDREFYSRAFADIEWLLAECDTLRAQLAAREGEIAALTIQSEQAEAEVLRHHGREDRLKEEALSWRRVSERLQGERLAAEARADTAEAQLRAQGWQPTETAPKDEVRVLLFNPDESLGAWAVQAGAHYEQLGGWQYDNQNPRYSNAHPPTHWMPLPAPPITKESQPHE